MGQLTARTHKDRGDDFFHYYHSDFMYANHGVMLRESYAGRRVHDLLSVLDLFQANSALHEILGATFAKIYGAVKNLEHQEFLQVISPWEREHLLLNV